MFFNKKPELNGEEIPFTIQHKMMLEVASDTMTLASDCLQKQAVINRNLKEKIFALEAQIASLKKQIQAQLTYIRQ